MNQKASNNRANQMNPNNPAYWNSRGNKAPRVIVKTVVKKSNHPSGNSGYPCKLCGRRGKLTYDGYTGYSDWMKCGWCGGIFKK